MQSSHRDIVGFHSRHYREYSSSFSGIVGPRLLIATALDLRLCCLSNGQISKGRWRHGHDAATGVLRCALASAGRKRRCCISHTVSTCSVFRALCFRSGSNAIADASVRALGHVSHSSRSCATKGRQRSLILFDAPRVCACSNTKDLGASLHASSSQSWMACRRHASSAATDDMQPATGLPSLSRLVAQRSLPHHLSTATADAWLRLAHRRYTIGADYVSASGGARQSKCCCTVPSRMLDTALSATPSPPPTPPLESQGPKHPSATSPRRPC